MIWHIIRDLTWFVMLGAVIMSIYANHRLISLNRKLLEERHKYMIDPKNHFKGE